MSSLPTEGPEHRTDTLSPVSPKPLHFPAPSNIALLETQMDPNFDGSTAEQQDTASGTLVSDATAVTTLPEPAQPLVSDNSEASNAGVTQNGQNALASVNVQSNGNDIPNLSTFADQDPSNLSFNAASSHGQSESTVQTDTSLPFKQPMPTTALSVNNSTSPSGQPEGQNVTAQGEAPPSIAPSLPPLPTNLEIQALLKNLTAHSNASTAPVADTLTATTTQTIDPTASETLLQSQQGQGASASSETPLPSIPNVASLPPRPPTQATPVESTLEPRLTEQPSAAASQTPQSTSNASFAPLANAAPPPLPSAGAPGVLNAATPSLPPPPIPSFQAPQQLAATLNSPISAAQTHAQQGSPSSKAGEDYQGVGGDEEVRWHTSTQRAYDDFLADERRYVQEGNWDKFPIGSRLFLGNLPSEKVTKRDLFHVFHRHGKLAQISIKQAYGFVQYLDAGHCARAMAIDQGVKIRGKSIHLEISVPGGKKRNQQNEGRSSRNRRSRSPPGSRNSGRNSRADGHRQRSPNRNRIDHYDGRQTRSPRQSYNSGNTGGYSDDARLPLPYRQPGQIPDVQVIAKEPLEKNFVQYIENAFTSRGMRADVLFLSPDLDESLVLRRQVVEGVLAVMRVDRYSTSTGKFSLTVFNRSAGSKNVQFDEYGGQELNIVVELALRARSTARPPQPQPPNPYYSSGTPMQQQQIPFPPTPQIPTNYSTPMPPPPPQGQQQQLNPNAIPNMDNAALQNLLQSLSQPPQASTLTPTHAQFPQTNQLPQLQQANTPDINSILQAVQNGQVQQQPQQGGNSAVDIQQIMAQLGRYGR